MSLLAVRLGLIDCPNARSSHSDPTPRGGGTGILAAFLLSATATGISMTFWLPISVLSVLAFWGDQIDLSPKFRLLAQLLLMGILVAGFGHQPSNPLWFLPWVLFWTVFIAGTANVYNFMDGINGMSGITGFLGFSLLAVYLFLNGEQSQLWIIPLCISFSCLGFLPLNLPKAKIFMGDIGSILLGSVFASLIFLGSATCLDFLCMASFLFPFYADALTTMLIRLKDGENLTRPHRRHIYQLLANESGIEHWKISVGFGLLQLVVSASVILVKPFGAMAVFSLLLIWFITFTSVSFCLRSFRGKSLRHQTNVEA